MNQLRDEDERLTALLRTVPIPEPSPDFLAGARRRYLEGLEARYRREVFIGIVAAAGAFGLAAILLRSALRAGTIAWVAVTMSSVAKWMYGIGIVLSLVPPLVLASSVLVSVVWLLFVVALLRVRSPVAVK
jgi:hypothetical protein